MVGKLIQRRKLLKTAVAAGVLAAPSVALSGWPNSGKRYPAKASAATGLLLDSLSATAKFAYSTRLLTNSYAGKCMNVSRDSDSTNMDIGFSGGNLDTATLLSFCSATNGRVRIWYDQSGTGNNLNNNQSPNLNAPIVSGGSLIQTLNGKPLIKFDTQGNYFTFATSGVTVSQPDSVAIIWQYITINTGHILDGLTTTRQLIGFSGSGPFQWQFFSGSSVETGGTLDTNAHGILGIFSSAASLDALYVDNSAVIGPVNSGGTNSFSTTTAGFPNFQTSSPTGYSGEFIVFTSALGSTDRATFHSNWQSWWAVG